ncbi:hypothetical protein [uncultured Arcticibacterium sp.]|uniref:hypothetical protein n=1 Tax=uncultured Arcticibacterium sp. TaxID=2173042 RepID=UPI0030F5E5FD
MKNSTLIYLIFGVSLVLTSCKEKDIGPFVTIKNVDFEKYLVDEGLDSDGMVNGRILELEILSIDSLNYQSFLSEDMQADRAHFRHLSYLSSNFEIGWQDLEQFTGLEKLHLRGGYENSGNVVLNIPGLQELTFQSWKVDSLDLKDLEHLNYLSISDSRDLRQISLPKTPSLNYLHIGGSRIKEIDFACINRSSWLREVNFSDNLHINSMNFENCTSLQRVYCTGNTYLKHLDVSDAKNLTELHTEGSYIDEICVRDLEQAEKRNGLILYYEHTIPKYAFTKADKTKYVECSE